MSIFEQMDNQVNGFFRELDNVVEKPMKTALAVTTQDGQILGVVRNDPEHQETINRSVTNIMRQHTKSDDVRYVPEQETYAIKTRGKVTVIYVREANIY